MKLIMLKQSSNRNQRLKGSQLKFALQMCVLLVICIWLIYQSMQFSKKAAALVESSKKEVKNEHQMLKLGRKNLNPGLNDLAMEFQKLHDKEKMETFEDEEIKLQDENEDDESSSVNYDLSVSIPEKTEEGEHEQLEDFIDEDDKEE